MISISIVSHGHGALVLALLDDLAAIARATTIEVIVTNNIPTGAVTRLPEGLPGRVIDNPVPQGFGHNHNNALAHARGTHLCVMNPDIRLPNDPFPVLLAEAERTGAGIVAPAILSPAGAIDNSARRFPTPWALFRRATGGEDGRYVYELGEPSLPVDFVAGMFILLPGETFRALGGFDQRYFLYYEDVDLCARMWRAGHPVILCPSASAIHDARRDSHRKLKFLRWHLASSLRFFATHWLRPVRSADGR